MSCSRLLSQARGVQLWLLQGEQRVQGVRGGGREGGQGEVRGSRSAEQERLAPLSRREARLRQAAAAHGLLGRHLSVCQQQQRRVLCFWDYSATRSSPWWCVRRAWPKFMTTLHHLTRATAAPPAALLTPLQLSRRCCCYHRVSSSQPAGCSPLFPCCCCDAARPK